MLGASDFLGDWTIRRTIDDRLGPPGRFAGVGTFSPAGDGLRYEESGLLTLGDAPPLRASRAALWDWDGDGVAVRFADGRPFHRFLPAGASPGTDHPCGADLYRVAYDFRAWPAWTATWEVGGPRKDYRMDSAYARP